MIATQSMSFPSARISAPIQVAGQLLNGQLVALVLGVVGVLVGIVMTWHDGWIAMLILLGSLPVLVISVAIIVLRMPPPRVDRGLP